MSIVDKISDAEWEVLQIVWICEEATATEVFDKLNHERRWKKNTVKTLLSRLVEKEVLIYEKKGRSYIYQAKYSKEECMQEKNELFLSKFYKGGVKDLFASFLRTEKLSQKDIQELRNMLEEIEE